MNAVPFRRVLGWLIRDTFRESAANGIAWALAAVTLVCVALCATATIVGAAALVPADGQPDFLPRNDRDAGDAQKLAQSGVAVVSGELRLAFGGVRIPLARDSRDAVRFLQLTLAGGVADTLGVLLCLIWTAGFLPSFLDARGITVLLAKPPARWTLLAGKYVGVVSFVAMHATAFVGATWLTLGWRTGIWDAAYLWAAPLLLLQFGVFFGFSLLLAVVTRSTVFCVFGSLLFWLLSWGMNFGRHALLAESYESTDFRFAGPLRGLVECGYWVLPKPADFGALLYNVLDASTAFGELPALAKVQSHGDFWPVAAVASSAAFALVMLACAAREFEALDY